LSTLFTAIFNSLVLLALMLYLSWWATLFVGVLGLFGVHGIRKLTDARARSAGKITYGLHADESRVAIDAIDGLKITKAYGLESTLSGRMMSLLKQEIGPAHRVAVFRYVPAFINEFAAGAVVIILCGISLLMPSLGLTFATLVAFLMAIRQCGASIANISFTVVELQNIRPRLSIVMDLDKALPREYSGRDSVQHVCELRLSRVSLRYASRDRVLHEIDLTMKKGSVTAIVGATGSGKSTIANLIVGIIQPTSGKILVDGRDLAELNLALWRRRIGYVPQDPFLFNTSIRNNIVLWDESTSQEELDRVAELAQLREFILSIPNGYDTMVGDRGLEISGGQAQRIAIARAILRKPEVLVFDEATSALDNLTEKAVYEAIATLRRDAIVVVIAHRLSTIRDADQIVVLEAGNIVEFGTHDSLVRDRGSYSRLYGTETIHD
jgi:ABC-type multidrug transport system fused ATPase/permease subunit